MIQATQRQVRWWVLALTAAGLCLRLPGLLTDFWMDEIWALRWAQSVDSPLDVLTGIHFDTNHWLYTLFMLGLGPRSAWWVYRVPALLAGIVSLPLMGLVARRDGRGTALTAVILGSASFLMVVYSSEARGYSSAILFSLLAYLALDRYVTTGRTGWAALFCAACILGILSHLTSLFVIVALAIWSIARIARTARSRGQVLRSLLVLHLAPFAAFAFLYLIDIRHVRHGGADIMPMWTVIQRVAALSLGTGQGNLPATGAVLFLAAVSGYEIIRLLLHKRDEAVFYAVAILLAPAALILASGDFAYWHPRHFIVCVPWILILLARFTARFPQAGFAGRAAFAALLAAFLCGNAAHLARFYRFGRGGYFAAVKLMAEKTPGPTVTLAGDHNLRHPMVLGFYTAYLPEKRFEYYKPPLPEQGTEWFLRHSLQGFDKPMKAFRLNDRWDYRLVRHFPGSGISGWHWYVYRRAETR